MSYQGNVGFPAVTEKDISRTSDTKPKCQEKPTRPAIQQNSGGVPITSF